MSFWSPYHAQRFIRIISFNSHNLPFRRAFSLLPIRKLLRGEVTLIQGCTGLKWQNSDLNVVLCESRPISDTTVLLVKIVNSMCSSRTGVIFKMGFPFSSPVRLPTFTSHYPVIKQPRLFCCYCNFCIK